MNDERHPSTEELADAETLADGHPVRRHLAGCARCQAQVLAFQRFVAEPSDVPAADRAEARARLHSALRSEMGLDRAGARSAAPPRRRWSIFLRPAFAVLLVAAAGVYLAVGPTPWRDPPDVLRESGGRAGLEVQSPTPDGDQLVVRWRPVAGADAYRVTMFTADLEPLDSPSTTTEPLLRLPLASFRQRFESGRWLYVRVVALQNGDEIADSGPRSFQAP